MFFTERVKDLKRPPTRPGFSLAFPSSSSPSEPESRDSTSSSCFFHSASSPESPRKTAFCASKAASSSSALPGLFLEKSNELAIFSLYLPSPSQKRPCLPFLGCFSSAAGGSSFFFVPFFAALPCNLARASATFCTSSPSSPPSSSSSSSSLPAELLPPFFLPCDAGRPFSSLFFCTSWPFLVSAKDLIALGRLDSICSLSTFRRTSMNALSKSMCFMFIPFPKPSATWFRNSFATMLRRPSR
mmetsp:Transcript_18220/g.45973  ORF Transcript_18220/g.45973 Transcript_18220/m.45973 type:complete len:243 (-) Transcript_18220:327-1055(-)